MEEISKKAELDEKKSFSPFVSWIAHIISYVVNPLLVPLYGTFLIIKTHFFYFAAFSHKDLILLYASIVTNTLILPVTTLLLLWKLKFISSLKIRTQKDRVIPYIAIMTFYFWTYLVFKNQENMPGMMKAFLLGNFAALVLAFLSNLKWRISLHALGLGVLIGLIFCLLPTSESRLFVPMLALFLATGLVLTARMILVRYSARALYLGLAFGIFAQLVLFWII